MSTQPIKVLLVDDTPQNLVAMTALLRGEDVELLTAESGAQALELLLVHEVAVALIDVRMPEMDGFELAELMRGTERTKHVPIIFVTAGSTDPQHLFQGYESGAVDFLYKPVDPHVLRSKVDVFLQLARQRRELAQSLHLNEMFVAIVGHDLRNPLAAIMAGAELLQMQLTEERQLTTVRRMTSAGRRMTAMIEQLLDLTRARMAGGVGNLVRAHEPVDVGSLVERIVEEHRAAHPARTIELTCVGDARVIGDPVRISQLVSNLVGNAITHGAGNCAIHVTCAARDDGNVLLEVRNEGAIPPDVLPEIFEPFRGTRARSARSAGLGLGLYISRQIAIAHGGDISASCPGGAETVFAVLLPRGGLDTVRVA